MMFLLIGFRNFCLQEAIAVGRSFASIKGYQIDGNKEMVAMGFMNIVGSLTSCYVATGSFSRTAVNFSAGCQTVVSNIVMAVTVLLSLLLITKLLYYTPIAILASIILSALPGLIDVNEALRIWRVDRLDFLACIGAFLGFLFGSAEIGLLAAVAISFGKIIPLSIRPGTELLGRLPGTDIFCDVRQYPMAIETPGVFLIRINSGLMYFANAKFIRERIMRSVTEENDDDATRSGRRKIQVVVLDMSHVMNIDTSGIAVLEELHKKLVSVGLEVAVANMRWQVIHKLKLANFLDTIGRERVFLSVGEAVEYSCLPSKFTGLQNC
ncbi:PlsC domain-containing protein [Psidium guajava]|nr:PlsC domain-containing protein [Psidium guajava]